MFTVEFLHLSEGREPHVVARQVVAGELVTEADRWAKSALVQFQQSLHPTAHAHAYRILDGSGKIIVAFRDRRAAVR